MNTSKYNNEKNQKLKTEYRRRLNSAEQMLVTYQTRSEAIEHTISNGVQLIKAKDTKAVMEAYDLVLTKYKTDAINVEVAAIEKYHSDRQGTSGKKMSRFTRFIKKYF